MNFIVKNSRGELPLWKSYWIAGFAGSLVVGVLAAIVVAVISEMIRRRLRSACHLCDPRRDVGRAALIFHLAVCSRLAFRRSLHLGSARSGKASGMGAARPRWRAGSVLRCFCSPLRGRGVHNSPATYAIAFRGDLSIPPFTIRVMRSNTEAEITGGFKYGLTDAFERVFETYPSIMTVHLDSIGGRIGEAEKLNKAIRLHRHATTSRAGAFRLAPSPSLPGANAGFATARCSGFTLPGLPGFTDFERKESVRRQRADFLASGVDPVFVDRALAVPNDQSRRPSAAELIAANVVTKVSHGGDFAMSGLGGDLDKQAIATFLGRDSPLLDPIRKRFRHGRRLG